MWNIWRPNHGKMKKSFPQLFTRARYSGQLHIFDLVDLLHLMPLLRKPSKGFDSPLGSNRILGESVNRTSKIKQDLYFKNINCKKNYPNTICT